MRTTVRTLPLLVIGLALGASLSLMQGVLAEKSQPAALPLEDLRTFAEIFEKIKDDYVEPVPDKDLLDNAIRGMLAGLDPHSAYLEPEDYKELRVGTTGEFGGLGIEVSMEDGFVKVVAPIDDTPAARAGVRAGDLIVRLDDTPVKGMSLNDAVKLMRGKPGSKITLTIMREGEEKPIKLTIVRDIIKVTSVKRRTLEPGYGYVRISQFQSRTGDALREAISDLKRDNGGSLKGLVLDLRNNPGGVLSAAVSVSDAFLSKGTIVYTEGRVPDSQLKFNAKPTDVLKGASMVVLVNGGSASASEIVAGALQDHHRAIVMGSRTFGKGSVQTILPMDNGSALKLTTARYFTPSGRSIQAEGIIPDIVVEDLKVARVKDDSVQQITEADLSHHLTNGDKKAPEKGSTKEDDDKRAALASEDYALYEALSLLKGLAIVEAKRD